MCDSINIYILFGCLYNVSCLVLDMDTVCGKVLSPALHATGLKFSPEAICNPNVIRNSELLIESPRLTCMVIVDDIIIEMNYSKPLVESLFCYSLDINVSYHIYRHSSTGFCSFDEKVFSTS